MTSQQITLSSSVPGIATLLVVDVSPESLAVPHEQVRKIIAGRCGDAREGV